MMPPVVLLPGVADFVLIGTGILLCVCIYNMGQCLFKIIKVVLYCSGTTLKWGHPDSPISLYG